MPVIDFTDVDLKNFDPIPAGLYAVTVTNAEERDSQSSEYQYLNLELEVIEGEFIARKLWDIFSYSPKALWKLKQFLISALCYNAEELQGSFELAPETLVGQQFIVHVRQKPDNRDPSIMRNTVQTYSPHTADATTEEAFALPPEEIPF